MRLQKLTLGPTTVPKEKPTPSKPAPAKKPGPPPNVPISPPDPNKKPCRVPAPDPGKKHDYC